VTSAAGRALRAFALGVVLSTGCATGRALPPPASGGAARPAPQAPAAAPDTADPTDSRAETRTAALTRTVDAVLASPAFARATVAFLVRSLRTGETIYARQPQTWLVPASTMKVLTTVAAAERLGWGFRFETRVIAMGPIVDGVVDGDLLVVGTGDPTINARHPSRVDVLDDWARQLKAQGIRRIAGRVIGDDRLVDAPGWGIGWAWDDLVEDYGAAVSALQFNENVVRVTMGPGRTPGAAPVVYLSPANHGLLLDVQAVTAAEDAPPALTVFRQPGTRFLEVRGQVPLNHQPLVTSVAVASPALLFAGELRDALQRQGIAVSGAGIDIRHDADPPRASDGTTLLIDLSAPLSEIATEMLAWSINLYAESLVVAMDQTPPLSTADGLAALRATLQDLGAAPESYHTRDGSGLSRNDYLSAAALVATLEGAWQRPALRAQLLQVLPAAGTPGTLERRLAGTPAAGRVRAKTGSMSNVRSLAGYVETIAGEPLAFAFLTNGFDVRASEIDARVDDLLLALVALPGSREGSDPVQVRTRRRNSRYCGRSPKLVGP
jgi:D-alanyl-D-alanine carboxypeptidase/D-alanyl-D-alanine-endopeptidase (penicillin-binding protein 4)